MNHAATFASILVNFCGICRIEFLLLPTCCHNRNLFFLFHRAIEMENKLTSYVITGVLHRQNPCSNTPGSNHIINTQVKVCFKVKKNLLFFYFITFCLDFVLQRNTQRYVIHQFEKKKKHAKIYSYVKKVG